MKNKLLSLTAILILIFVHNLASAQKTWTKKSDYGTPTYRTVGFSIGTKGYIGTGVYHNDFWEWDQTTNVWTQKSNSPASLDWGVGFSIGTKGYIGLAQSGFAFWEWDQSTNQWTRKSNYPGAAGGSTDSIGITWDIVGAVGFSIGNKGYIGTGNQHGADYNDFWEFNPATDTWTQKANIGSAGRYGSVGFSIGNKGYIGTGASKNTLLNDFWEWDQNTNVWMQKANLPGGVRYSAAGFSIGRKGYIGTGLGNGSSYKDFWEWDQASDTWSQKPDFTGGNRCRAVGFSIGKLGYMGTGTDSTNADSKDFWEFNPRCGVSPKSICMVTVDSTDKNIVVWEKPSIAQPIDSFRIYREVSSTYKHIGSVSFAAFSVFTDTTIGVNPKIASYKYKISGKDSCGNETPLSAFHKTIHLALSPASPCGYNLLWNDYIGFPITQYLIYRDSAKTGWKVVDSLSFGNTAWTDITCYAISDTIAYLIKAITPAGCTPSMKNPALIPKYASVRSNTQRNYSTNSVQELTNKFAVKLSPNPFSTQTTLLTDNIFHNATLTMVNYFGQIVKQIKNISGKTITLYRDNLPSGLYFIRMTQDNEVISADKLVITGN
jgi:Secretion system C-terminal sorting domain